MVSARSAGRCLPVTTGGRARRRARRLVDAPARRRGALLWARGPRVWSHCSRRDRGASPLLRVVAPSAVVVSIVAIAVDVGTSPRRSRSRRRIVAAGSRSRHRSRRPRERARVRRRDAVSRCASRTPLLLGPVPLAVLARRRGHRVRAVAARRRPGRRSASIALVVGFAVAAFLARSLHALVAPLVRAGSGRRRRRRSAHPARTGADAPRARSLGSTAYRAATAPRATRSTCDSASTAGSVAILLRGTGRRSAGAAAGPTARARRDRRGTRRRPCVRDDAARRRRPAPHRDLTRRSDPATARRSLRRARRRRRSTRRPGRARHAAAARRTTTRSPSSARRNGVAVRAGLHEHRSSGGTPGVDTAPSSSTWSRSRSSRVPTVTVPVAGAMSIDVAAFADRDTESAPLPDRERVDAVVRADDRAVAVDDRARASAMRAPRNASRPPRVMKQTSMLSALRRGAEPERRGARRAPRPSSARRPGAACARARGGRACRARTTGPWPGRRRARAPDRRRVDDARVVTGRDDVEAELQRALEHAAELHRAVALDARVRRLARCVGVDVRVDDVSRRTRRRS